MIAPPDPPCDPTEPPVLHIGPHAIPTRVVLAPMVGVTDLPFRRLCARLGTRLGIAEMISADQRLWSTRKSRHRSGGDAGLALRWVQIAGNDPRQMAEAARAQAGLGAEVIDINMGCPAKNVCGKGAGSALLRDEPLVAAIIESVVAAVPGLPVTLKMRTGWSPELRNGARVARIAEAAGVRLLSVHGRTRACRFAGEAEYDTIREIVRAVGIPVLANGDIRDTGTARRVLEHTGAAGVMVGRAAQGRPWLCAAIDAALEGRSHAEPSAQCIGPVVLEHLGQLHSFYGEAQGVRIARKHIGWYLGDGEAARGFLRAFHAIETAAAQREALSRMFAGQTPEVLAA